MALTSISEAELLRLVEADMRKRLREDSIFATKPKADKPERPQREPAKPTLPSVTSPWG